jgi:hypothetical protein
MIRDFCLIMLGVAIQIFSAWLVAKLKAKNG